MLDFIHAHQIFFSHYALIAVLIGALMGAETILILASIVCHKNGIPIQWVALTAIVGAIVANQVWFKLGTKFGLQILNHHPHLNKDMGKFKKWIQNKADLTALGSRFIYGGASLIPLLLGTNHYPNYRFFIMNILSAILWASLFIKISYTLGANIQQLLQQMKYLEVSLLIIILLMVAHWFYKHRKLKQALKNPK